MYMRVCVVYAAHTAHLKLSRALVMESCEQLVACWESSQCN